MAKMNDHLISLFSDYGGNDSSPIVRAKASSSSHSHRLINDQLIPIIIYVSDDSESERLSSGSLGRRDSFNESSFDTLFF